MHVVEYQPRTPLDDFTDRLAMQNALLAASVISAPAEPPAREFELSDLPVSPVAARRAFKIAGILQVDPMDVIAVAAAYKRLLLPDPGPDAVSFRRLARGRGGDSNKKKEK